MVFLISFRGTRYSGDGHERAFVPRGFYYTHVTTCRVLFFAWSSLDREAKDMNYRA